MLFLFVKLNGAVTWIMLERWLTSLKFVDIMGRFTWRWVTPVFAYYLFDEMFASILWYAAGCFFCLFIIFKWCVFNKENAFCTKSSSISNWIFYNLLYGVADFTQIGQMRVLLCDISFWFQVYC
jgi:hypothetical protein